MFAKYSIAFEQIVIETAESMEKNNHTTY